MSETTLELVPLGTQIKPYGKVAAVGYVGERYYWLRKGRNCVSMMPADVIEPLYAAHLLAEVTK